MGIEAVGSATSSTASSNVQAPDGLGRDAFMKLLVAQLKNQDPQSPLDARDFVTQLSQLTGVEQLAQMNDRLVRLEIATTGIASTDAIGLVGKNVTVDTSKVHLDEAGSATLAFELGAPAADARIVIRDEAGRVVRELDADALAAGPQTLVWDGRDASGQRAPEGTYRVSVEAKGEGGQPVTATMRHTGTVDAVSYENGYPELVVGGLRILLGDLVSVSTLG